MRLNLPLIIASYRIAWRSIATLAPLFVLFALLVDAVETLAGMGTLERAWRGLDPSAFDTAVSGSANLLGLVAVLVILVLLLPIELVWFLGLMQRLRSGERMAIVPFVIAGYRTAFLGFWQGFGRFLAMSFSVGLVAVGLAMGVRSGLGMAGVIGLGVLVGAGILGIVLFILPYAYATYRCVLDAPIAFEAALPLSRADLKGRRPEVILSLVVAYLPNLALALLPLPSGIMGALLALIGGAVLSIPGTVLTYLFQEDFEKRRRSA